MLRGGLYPQALIEIRFSKMLQGQIGLFAVRNLKKGTIIGHSELFGEEFYSWKDYVRLDKPTRRMIGKYCICTEDGFWGPDNINYLSLPWHMNHCCSGNVGFDEQGNFITIKYVRAGYELSYDYGLAETNPRFKMKCMCGSGNCRKIITGKDWNNPVFRKKNLNIMTPELRSLNTTLQGATSYVER
jgi:hypothetical protein